MSMDDTNKVRDAMHRAAAAVILQGGQSVDRFGTCQYRGIGGRKCVVGHMIADEHYHAALEGVPAFSVNVRAAVGRSLSMAPIPSDDLELLQYWHDDAGNGEGRRSSVRHTTESFADWKLRTLPDFIDRALVERLVQEGQANG